jgi:regulatory protein
VAEKSILQKIKTYCAYQERSHNEVRYKLVALGARGLELEQIITVLIEENYLNEQRFAEIFAGSKHRVLGWGKVKIELALKQKQVSSYCIRYALQAIDATSYALKLQKILGAKLASYKAGYTPYELSHKLTQYALQKGYSHKDIRLALPVVLNT